MIPFQKVRELIVSTFTLVEAEARALKGAAVRIGASVVGLLGALALVIGAFWMFALAMYSGLTDGAGLEPAWAWLISGGVYLVVAGGVAWLMIRLAKG
ncbi:MAG: hypothetical protein WD749_04195 [Phycisphaerales bacterium]